MAEEYLSTLGALSKTRRISTSNVTPMSSSREAAVATMKYENGEIIGPRKSISLREVAEAWYLRPQELPPDVDLGGLEATVGFRPKRDTGAFSYASHAAVVVVDTKVGAVEILDYVIVDSPRGETRHPPRLTAMPRDRLRG